MQMEAKAILSKLLTKFSFQLPKGYESKMVANLSFQPKDMVPVTVTMRGH